ncbi:MAG: hypothetical protein L0Z53_04725 [Acidobacteriales bacterium]|nr:hypothetical protein [Terriglobales bacterium]
MTPSERFYELAEAAKACGISRGRLDHACRVGRIPFTRSETGSRLLSESVVEKLRKHGLSAFPRPYFDPAPQAQQEETTKPSTTAAERLGLLGEPSATLRKAKEDAEAVKLKVDQEKARLELSRVQHEQERARRAAAAEREAEVEQRRAEQEAEAERRREEAEERRYAVQAQRERERRARWLKEQLSLALSEGRYELWRYVPHERQSEGEESIAATLVREMEKLTPDSPLSACQKARQAAVERAVAPYKAARTIEESLEEIPRYLERLYEDGYINLRPEDRAFLAKRLRPCIKTEVERQAEARGNRLSEEEARQLVRDTLDHHLKLA